MHAWGANFLSDLRKAWHLYKLMRSQWKSFEDLSKLQNKKLKAVIKYAYEYIPLYHRKFKEAGVKPDEIKTVKDLTKLPYTTKSEIQANFPNNIVAKHIDIKKCHSAHTSGSTGTPLTVVYDEKAEDFQKAVALRPNLSCGQRLFDKWIVFTDPRHIGKKKWFQGMGLFNPEKFSLFLPINKQIEILERVLPDIIECYPSHLYLLAKLAKENGAKINPRLIFSSAELLDQRTRHYIEDVFNSKVYDQYGGTELGRTAWECPERCGYHIDMEAVVMEFIQGDEQVTSGEKGEIVYTSLYNYAMPLIRYKSGDIGVPTDEKCPCGRELPLMKVVMGRKDDFLVATDGSLVSPITMDLIVKNMMEIEQCRIIQERKNLISVQIVEKESLSEGTVNQMTNKIKEVLGKDMEVKVEKLDELERDRSGKLRKVISKVNLKNY